MGEGCELQDGTDADADADAMRRGNDADDSDSFAWPDEGQGERGAIYLRHHQRHPQITWIYRGVIRHWGHHPGRRRLEVGPPPDSPLHPGRRDRKR